MRRSKAVFGLILVALILGITPAARSLGSVTAVNVSGISGAAPGTTQAFGINNTGQVVGTYQDASSPFATHGFLMNGSTFSKIDVPFSGATGTTPQGINTGGSIVGYYSDLTGFHGFLYAGGTYKAVDVTLSGAHDTMLEGINSNGVMVGWFSDSTGVHGFIDSGGSFTSLSASGSKTTEAFGIDGNGRVVGFYLDSSANAHGFVYVGGTFTTMDPTGVTPAVTTMSPSINNEVFGSNLAGQISGFYADTGFNIDGFVCSGNSYSSVVLGDGSFTSAYGINDNGQLVGTYNDATGSHGFYTAASSGGSACGPMPSTQKHHKHKKHHRDNDDHDKDNGHHDNDRHGDKDRHGSDDDSGDDD